MADFSHRNGGSGAPTAEERHIGGLGNISEVHHESIQRCCSVTLHDARNDAWHINIKVGMQFVVLYLRVMDGGVVEGIVGEDVSPVVDLLQTQIHHWDTP